MIPDPFQHLIVMFVQLVDVCPILVFKLVQYRQIKVCLCEHFLEFGRKSVTRLSGGDLQFLDMVRKGRTYRLRLSLLPVQGLLELSVSLGRTLLDVVAPFPRRLDALFFAARDKLLLPKLTGFRVPFDDFHCLPGDLGLSRKKQARRLERLAAGPQRPSSARSPRHLVRRAGQVQ